MENFKVQVSREASLKEVLAEVSLLDLWFAIKGFFLGAGCLLVMGIIMIIISKGISFVFDINKGFTPPKWAEWFFLLWAVLSIYTKDKSYHEHNFSWYFPKLGWFWSLLFAGYIVAGVELIYFQPHHGSFWISVPNFLVYSIWIAPLCICISLLRIGHKRLVNKRMSYSENCE